MNKRNAGFSLVETLIASAILAGGIITIMKFNQKQIKDTKAVEVNYAALGVVEKIKFILSSEANCSATFNGRNPNGGTVSRLRENINGSFQDVLRTNELLPSKVEIKSYKLLPAAVGMASNELLLQVEFFLGESTDRKAFTKVLRLVHTLTAGVVNTCYAYSNSNVFWKRSDTNPSSLVYEAGSVGVGVSDPAVKLDVSGPIKLGAPGSCNTGSKGTIAYDSTLKQVVFCNGTNWVVPSGGTGALTEMGAACGSGSTQTTNTTNLGTQQVCFLKKVRTDNRNRDDHTRGQCILRRLTVNTWQIQAVCKEADTRCEVVCVN